MNSFDRMLVAIATLAVVAIGGLIMANGSTSGPVGRPSPGAPSPAMATPAPQSTPTAPSTSLPPAGSSVTGTIDTSGWIAFASARHGITLRHPAGWKVTKATAPWPAGTTVIDDLPGAMVDTFTAPDGQLFMVASQPLPARMTGEVWLALRQSSAAAASPAELAQCWPAPADLERQIVDGQPAWLYTGCGRNEAITTAGGRVYDIVESPDPFYNRPLFDALLSTVKFDPASANDRAVRGSPTPGTH